MKIVVCYKNVPDPDSIQIRSDRTLDLSSVSWEIGQYDLNAIEAAVQLAAGEPGSQVTALTAAGEMAQNSKQKKAVLSRGPDKMLGIKDERLDNADPFLIAKTLAATIKHMGDVDLVLFGEGSGDQYSQQTGVLTGCLLGWNTVNAVRHIQRDEEGLTVKRASDQGVETLKLRLPAAVSVTGDINTARIPTLKDILAAGKKPLENLTPEELGVSLENTVSTVSVLAPQKAERRQQVYKEASEDSLNAIVKLIQSVK